jgi:hypothetical protein
MTDGREKTGVAPQAGLRGTGCEAGGDAASRIEVPIYVMGEAGPFVIATVNRCDGCGLGLS